jgi:hypothetical protein
MWRSPVSNGKKSATSSSPTNLSIMPSWSKTTFVAVVKYRSSRWWNSPGVMCSASEVEPRISAKSIVPSISAPPWCLARNFVHEVHHAGFDVDARLPMSRMIGAPGPANGAAHIRHRGSLGMRLNRRRPMDAIESPPCSRNRPQNSSSRRSAPDGLGSTASPSLLRGKRMTPVEVGRPTLAVSSRRGGPGRRSQHCGQRIWSDAHRAPGVG